MPQARSRLILILTVSSLLALLAGILIIIGISIETPYSVVNNSDNGLSELYDRYRGRVLYEQAELANYKGERTLLVAPRTTPLKDIGTLNNYVEKGGLVIVYGKPEYIINFLRALGINTSFIGYVRTGLPALESEFLVSGNVYNIDTVFKNPYTIRGVEADYVIAWSSYLSYLDLNENNLYDLGEPIGPQILGLEISIGEGKYVVLFTEFFLENNVLTYNTRCIDRLLETRELIIDQSEHVSNPLVYLKLTMETRSSPPHMYVSLALIIFIILVAYIVVKE
ncbi:MAG: hypothetical protein QXE81_01925 [Desulfurococcaceae archaeon]